MPPEADTTAAKPKVKPADKQPDKPAKDDPTALALHQHLQEIHGPAAATKTNETNAGTKPSDAAKPPKPGDAKPGDTIPHAAPPGSPAAAPAEAPHLSTDVIQKKAEELHAAIFKKGMLWGSSPDSNAVTEALSGTNAADRKAIEDYYQGQWGKGGPKDRLRADMHANLPEVDFRKAEATLNTRDGHTNDAGALMTAMTLAKTDQERGSNDVRAILQSLDSKTLADVRKDFADRYPPATLDASLTQSNLNATAKESLSTLMHGVDKISSADLQNLASIALKHGDKRAFCEAIRGDSAEAKAARDAISHDHGLSDQIRQKFSSWGTPDAVVNDYLKDGKVSLNTVIESNHRGWPFDNAENTGLAAQHATDDERKRFVMGKDLYDSHAANLNAEQKAALAYYNQVHEAFNSVGSARQTSAFEDQLIHGRETVISQMAGTHSDGYLGLQLFAGHDSKDLMSRAENLSKEDWAQLTTHPQGNETQAAADKRSGEFRKEIQQSLDTYADPGEKTRIMAMLDQKAHANTYEESQQVKRSLTEVMGASTSHGLFGTSYDTKTITNRIGEMSQNDVNSYNNPKPPATNAYRDRLDSFVKNNMSGSEQLEARRLLDKAAQTGKPAQLDAVDNFLHAKNNGGEPANLVGLAEKALSDPALRQRLNQPDDKLSPADRELKAQIENATIRLAMSNTPPGTEGAMAVQTGPTYTDLNNALFKDGHIPAEMKLQMGFPQKDVVASLPSAPQSERDAASKYLTPEEKKVVDQASKNPDHQLSLADKMRLSIVGSNAAPSSSSDFEQDLSKMSNEQKIALKNEYSAKYGHKDLDSDLGASLNSDSDRLKFRQLLATTDSDGRQNYYDNYDAMIRSESGLSPDGSKLTMERANDVYATSIQEYQKIYQTLPREKQEALDKYFGESMKQYKDSKQKLAEIAVDATITAAALAAAPFTAGASTLVLMSSAAAFGATFRVTAMAAIEGNDFDSSGKNIAKQMIIGGTAAATNFFGGAGLAAAAEQGGKVLTREGAIAAAKLLAKESVESGLIGAGSNVVSDLVVAPFNKNGIDIEQLERSALTGLAVGAVMPVAFKGIGKVLGAGKQMIVNLTKEADGLHINPHNLTEPVSFRNATTGEVMHFKPGEGEDVKLSKDWVPIEVAAAAAAVPAAEAISHTVSKVAAPEVAAPEVTTPAATPPVPIQAQSGDPLRLASAEQPQGTLTPGADSPGKAVGPAGPTEPVVPIEPTRTPATSKVAAEKPAIVDAAPTSAQPTQTANNSDTTVINGTNGEKATAHGPDATIRVQSETPGTTVQNLDLKITGGAKAEIHEGTGKISGAGTVEVSGNSSRLEVNVPEGQTMRLVLKDGSPDIQVAPGSKGKIEVVRENGLELPEGLRKYRDNTRQDPKVEILERNESGLPLGERAKTPEFSPVALRERTQELENLLRKQSQPITRDQWRDMFDGVHDMHDGGPPRQMTADERKIALEVMQQSAPNMNSRAVDQQMRRLGETIKPGKNEKVTVYVANGNSDGNQLAHIFAKNNPGTEIEIKQLTTQEAQSIEAKTAEIAQVQAKLDASEKAYQDIQAKLKDKSLPTEQKRELGQALTKTKNDVFAARETLTKPGGLLSEVPANSIVFDDLSSMSVEQRKAIGDLSAVRSPSNGSTPGAERSVTTADMNGFSRGVNMFDFAVTAMTGDASTMNEKVADIVKGANAIKAAHPGMSDSDAVSKFLKDGSGATIENPGANLRQQAEDPSIAMRRNSMKAVERNESETIDALYRHATEPMVTKEQMNAYLAGVAADVERSNAARLDRGLEPLSGKPEDYQNAALTSLERNVHFNDYSTMVKQAGALDSSIKSRLAAEGLGKDDYLVVTGLESDGSSYLANGLYGRANKLPTDRYISMDQLKALAGNPEEAERVLGHKKLVFLEDYRNSGRQQAELLKNAQRDTLSHIKGPDGQPLVKGVIAGNFASHELPAGSANPFTKYGDQYLFNAEPHSTEVQPPGTLAVESISGDHYLSLQDYPTMVRRGVSDSSNYYNEMGARSMYNQSSVSTGIFTPYGSPNNNPRYLTRAERHFDLPMRYADGAYDIFNRTGEKVARPITSAGNGAFNGGAPTDAQAFDDMIDATNAGVVIDLRAPNDSREVEAIAREKEWARSNPRSIETKNIPIPTTLPEAGTENYNKFLGQLHEFENTMQSAREDGKNVFYHCAWGQDRTGMVQAIDQVISQHVPIEQALANWKALKEINGYDQGFFDLYHENKLRQLIADYRAKYPES